MGLNCKGCGSPVSRWSDGGRCRSCERAERGKREAVRKYRDDMALLSFIREGGTQMEWAQRRMMTRAAVSGMVRRAKDRTGLVHRMMLEGDPLADRLLSLAPAGMEAQLARQ